MRIRHLFLIVASLVAPVSRAMFTQAVPLRDNLGAHHYSVNASSPHKPISIRG